MARDLGRADAAAPKFVAAFEHVRVGDLLRPRADLNFRAIFLDQRFELLEQIGAKILRLGHRRRIDAGRGEFGEGARIGRRRAFGAIGDPEPRIAELRPLVRSRRHAVAQEAVERLAQRRDGVVIVARQQIDRVRGRLGFDERRGQGFGSGSQRIQAVAATITISTV